MIEIINEFERLILINHTVAGDLRKILTDVYNSGIELGKVQAMFGSDFSSTPQAKRSNTEKMLEGAVAIINPTRIANKRNMKYTGADITHYSILACDFTVKQTIKMLASRDNDYMYFERDNFEAKAFEERIESAYDQEEKDFIIKEHNTLEVRIFILKCFQVGYSEGTKLADRIPIGIKTIYSVTKDLNDYKSGKKSHIDNDELANSLADMVVKNKTLYPSWEEYKEYFEI